MREYKRKRCRFIPDVSITAQDQVVDLNRLLHNMDPYLSHQFLRSGTYDANVDINSDIDYFDRRDFDFCDIFEYERSINQARFMPAPNKTDSDNVSAERRSENDSAASANGTASEVSGESGFERK